MLYGDYRSLGGKNEEHKKQIIISVFVSFYSICSEYCYGFNDF